MIPDGPSNSHPSLNEEADRYRRLLAAICNNATVALFIMDEHQHCIFMNPAAEKLTGFTLAEVMSRPLHDVIHHTRPDGSHFPLEECPIDRVFPENNQEHGEEIFVHKDGHFYPVAYTASPIRDEDYVVGTIIEVRDISREKDAQEALRRSEERYARAAKAGKVGVWELEIETNELFLAPNLKALLGYTDSELPNHMDAWCPLVHPDDKENTIAAAQAYIEGRADKYEVEVRRRHKNGTYLWFLARGTVLRDQHGKPYRMIGSDMDITEYKVTREALKESEALLRTVVRETSNYERLNTT